MGKLCKDQLIGKLVPLFRDANTDIDEAVKEAKDQLATEAKKVKAEDLEKLFNSQIQTLKNCGCPQAIVDMLANQRGAVVEKASKMTFAEERIPFLPIISRTYLTIYSQMPMVKNGEKVGYTLLDPKEITDVVETPKDPYYIYDVEDGQEMLGKAPQDAEKLIKKQGRRCLTDVEVISLGIHVNVLSKHYVDATGSRYKSSDKAPYLCLYDGKPKLYWDYVNYSNSKWGSASCSN